MAPGWDEEVARPLRSTVEVLLRSPVTRRGMRYRPAETLTELGLAAPEPPGPLVTRVTGVSVQLTDELLFGRCVTGATPPVEVPSAATESTDAALWRWRARPLSLGHHPERVAESLVARTLADGAFALLGPRSVLPVPDPGRRGFADLGSERPSVVGDGAHRVVLRSRDGDLVVLAWLALLFRWDAFLGVLLGYPCCCATFFEQAWPRARAELGGDVSRLLTPQVLESGLLATCNPFARDAGGDLPLHFPCAPRCAATDAQVTAQTDLLRLVDPVRAGRLVEAVHRPVSLAGKVVVPDDVPAPVPTEVSA